MKKETLLTLLIFLVLTTILTYPLVFRSASVIPAFFSTDEPFGALWDYWRVCYSFKHNLPLKNTYLIAWPFGLNMFGTGTNYYFHWVVRNLLGKITSPIFAYNFQIILNFILAGLLFYLLVAYLRLGRYLALFTGIIFAFCPYQFVRSWQHLSLTYNEWIPLCLFAFILLRDKFSKKSFIIAVVSLLLLFSFDYSIMYLTAITLSAFLIYMFLYNWRNKLFNQKVLLREDLKYAKRAAFVVLIVFIILLPQLYNIFKNILFPSEAVSFVSRTYRKSFEDLFMQSARPLSYILPAVVHPIFGKFTENFIGSSLYGMSFTEHTLYLGWTPLILAFVAIRRWGRKRREAKNLGIVSLGSSVDNYGGDSPYREDFYIGFFIFLAIVAWFFSQPPWWKFGQIKIYMPSFFMYKILPMFRAYCRFGIVVMLAVAVLAGFGLKFILERFKSQKIKIVLICLFSGLVLFEFWNWPPYKVIDVSRVPAVYYWLKNQVGDFTIAEYPSDAEGASDMYKFYQTEHEKKIINGTLPGTYANKVAQTIIKLSEPDTAGILKWMGVKYVLVHRDGYLQTGLVEDSEELNEIPQNKNLKFIKSFPPQECPQKNIMCVQAAGPIEVYEVIANPEEPKIEN